MKAYMKMFLKYIFNLLRFIFYNSFNTKTIVVAGGRGLTLLSIKLKCNQILIFLLVL